MHKGKSHLRRTKCISHGCLGRPWNLLSQIHLVSIQKAQVPGSESPGGGLPVFWKLPWWFGTPAPASPAGGRSWAGEKPAQQSTSNVVTKNCFFCLLPRVLSCISIRVLERAKLRMLHCLGHMEGKEFYFSTGPWWELWNEALERLLWFNTANGKGLEGRPAGTANRRESSSTLTPTHSSSKRHCKLNVYWKAGLQFYLLERTLRDHLSFPTSRNPFSSSLVFKDINIWFEQVNKDWEQRVV